MGSYKHQAIHQCCYGIIHYGNELALLNLLQFLQLLQPFFQETKHVVQYIYSCFHKRNNFHVISIIFPTRNMCCPVFRNVREKMCKRRFIAIIPIMYC